jgi:hypothetical protein
MKDLNVPITAAFTRQHRWRSCYQLAFKFKLWTLFYLLWHAQAALQLCVQWARSTSLNLAVTC